MDIADISRPRLDYRYEFGVDELDAMEACVDSHGFALIKGVLPDYVVEVLQKSVLDVVDPDGTLEAGQSRTHLSFVEESEHMWRLLDYEPFMNIHRQFCKTDAITINRSAAIVRKTGSSPVGWHTDWRGFSDGPPKNTGDVLNRGPEPSGKWFYISGSYPAHGGLAVIENSHEPDWTGPEGFVLSDDRSTFYKEGDEAGRYDDFDIPGLVPFFTDPNDMIIFAARTYHGAFSNGEKRVRLSCAVGFRPTSRRTQAPWALPESAQKFVRSLPAHLKRYVDGYTGIDPKWKG